MDRLKNLIKGCDFYHAIPHDLVERLLYLARQVGSYHFNFKFSEYILVGFPRDSNDLPT